MKKYAVVTTFPSDAWHLYAEKMVRSFRAYWPQDIKFIAMVDDENIAKAIQDIGVNEGDVVGIGLTNEQSAFLRRNQGKDDPKDYRKMYTRFSHKVFSCAKALEHVGDADYLIWLDADIVTHKPITHEDIQKWMPSNGGVVSYLGRKDWDSSETGFVAFDLNHGKHIINEWKGCYVTDELLKHDQWTDAYALDVTLKSLGAPTCNLTADIPGRDVFDHSPMAEFMTHYKGQRKLELAGQPMPEKLQHSNAMNGKTFDIGQLGIQTKNCVQDDSIKRNVMANLQLIKNWVQPCKAHDEEIVICSAGPSFSISDILEHHEKGTKIVAVKHALKRFEKAGMKPWGCVLLDPREHVSNFVKYPDRDIIWFVASMVDPAVTEHLLAYGCKVIGYHAIVGAGEVDHIPNGHLLVEGGSATSTRGISLFKQMGFRTMHLYGYDCCYFAKPDLQESKDNGRLRYEELTLSVDTWGGKKASRTVWTEGQFLAQVQEMEKIYFPDESLTLSVYGEGIIPWMYRNKLKAKRWLDFCKNKHLEFLDKQDEFDVWLTNSLT